MNVTMTARLKGVTSKVKGLNYSGWTHLKTQTNIELTWTKKDRPKLDFFNDLTGDVALLDAGSLPLTSLTVIVEGCASLGKIVNRSIIALGKMGVVVEEIDWTADSGLIEFTLSDGLGSDLAALVETVARMVLRATTKFSNTQHPLSTFDLKQTCGLIKDASDKLEGAQDVLDWFSLRELVIAEEEKAARKEVARLKREEKAAATKASKDATKAKAKKSGAKKKAPKAPVPNA
jgi:hypothetical protein